MRKLLAASTLLLGLVVGLPDGTLLGLAHADPAVGTPANPTPAAPNRYGLPNFADLVQSVGPAVVNIAVVQEQTASSDDNPLAEDPFYDFLRRFGVPVPGMPGGPGGPGNGMPHITRGIGSGFIVSPDGYVLTNAHVVGDGKAEVTVRLTDKREFKGKVIGSDARTDVALLKIEATGLPTVRFGNPDATRVGDWVIAVGSPFGFENTVTAGIVSAKARRLPDENYVPFIQTDVAINPGNSGGPLFNLAGEVIGINSQIYSRSGGFMGISFAIPIDVAMKVKDQLAKYGKVQRGRLGVTIQTVDKDLAQSFGLDQARGALVSNVDPDGPAAKAGLRAGDVVLAVDGKKIEDSAELPRIIGDKHPGSKVKLDIWRDGKSREVSVTLAEMENEPVAEAGGGSKNAGGKLGLAARPLNAQEARQLGVEGGLVVEGVNGPAARAGLRPGDVILAVNNQPVKSVDQFRELVDRTGERFALLVQRGDTRIFVPMKVG